MVQELEINVSRADSAESETMTMTLKQKKTCEKPNNKIIETLLIRCVGMSAFLFFGSLSLSFLGPL